jgi:hypothetical protein
MNPVVGCGYSWRTDMGKLTILPQSPNIQFCTTFNAIYASTDGGLQWQPLIAAEHQQIDSHLVAVSRRSQQLS